MQTLQDAILKTVMWWSDKTFRLQMNQDNGDKTPMSGVTSVFLNSVAIYGKSQIEPHQIKHFEGNLEALLLKQTKRHNLNLSVDYGPCDLLFEAATLAKIKAAYIFPIKSSTRIDEQNRVFAKLGYGNPEVEI